MSHPPEYENLIKTRALEPAVVPAGAVQGFLRNAADYLGTANALSASERPLQVFTLCYEGYFQLVQAVLAVHQVRAKDAGRNMVIQRVSADLRLTSAEMAFIIRAHERRNGTSYTSPFPPVSKAEAEAMRSLLGAYLPQAVALAGQPTDDGGT